MTPLTHAPVQHVVNDVNDAPTGLRAHLPNITLALLRVVAGLMFMQHGAQKLFGVLMPPDRPFTGGPDMFSMMWFAGIIEIGGGLLLAAGVLTRIVAFLMAGQMAVAYFMVHNPQNFWPILNGGELAALYCFVFLMFAAIGGGRYSLDQMIRVRRAQPAVQPEYVATPELVTKEPTVKRAPRPVHNTDIDVPLEGPRPTREP